MTANPEHWSTIVSAALLGTATRRVSTDGVDPCLAASLSGLDPQTPPAELVLHTAALTAVAQNAQGPATATELAPLPPSPDDPRRVMSPRLAVTVNKALKYPDVAAWCLTPIANAGLRAPIQLLPTLLRHTATHADDRAAITSIVGPRGAWLAAAAPKIGARIVDTAAPDIRDWQDGTAAARKRYLVRLCRSDPAAAATLIDEAWGDLKAAHRVQLLPAIAPALSDPNVEQVFERALDDEGAAVRAAALQSLRGTAGTGFERRMRDLASTLARRRRTMLGHRIEIASLGEPDEAALRDGIAWPPRQGVSMAGHWIEQLTAALPLSAWESALGADPTALVAANGEFRAELRAGWLAAGRRSGDARWAMAFADNSDPFALALMPGPWSDGVAERVCALFGQALAVDDWSAPTGLPELITAAAARLPVGPLSPWPQRIADQVARGTASRTRLFAPLTDILRLRTIIDRELP